MTGWERRLRADEQEAYREDEGRTYVATHCRALANIKAPCISLERCFCQCKKCRVAKGTT